MFKKLIFGKYINQIERLQVRCARQEKAYEKAEDKICELMDIREELRVIIHKTQYGRMELVVAVSDPSPISIHAQPTPMNAPMGSERIELERCIGYYIIEDRGYLEEASERLQHLIADYCGKFLTEKIKKDLK